MTAFSTITGYVKGDNLSIVRTVTSVPTAETVSRAWFMVKRSASDIDADAKISKEITDATALTIGRITENVAGTSAKLTFNIAGADWDNIEAEFPYVYDIQAKSSSSNSIVTIETGIFMAEGQITQDTA